MQQRPEDPPRAGLNPAGFALVAFATALALALLLYYPTLGSSWAYDDVDYINQAADTMAGRQTFPALLLRPQGEHIVAGFRLALYASLKLFGIAALPFRLAVLVAHAASALFLGLVARRYGGSSVAGLAAAVLYVSACGFSSMWIWFPSGSAVPFAMAALTGAMAVLAHRQTLGVRRARLVAGALVAVALLTESTLAPMAAVPIVLDEFERRRAGSRGPVGLFLVFGVATAALVAVLVTIMYRQTFAPRMSVSFLEGVPRSAFLLLVAPFRLFVPGVPFVTSDPNLKTAVIGILLGVAVAAPAAALLIALWRQGAPRLAGVAALTLLGPLGVLGLVGLGRWRTSYWEFYDADRYFFTLLVPLSLLAGAVAGTVADRLRAWPRRPRTALLLLLLLAFGAELALHRRAMTGRIPFGVYQAHEDRFAQLGRLAARLQETARNLPPGAPPLVVPDADIWLPDVHNGRIAMRTVLYVLGRGPGPRLRLGGPTVTERDARLLNPVLAAWAREMGEPLPYLAIEDGRLTDAHTIPRVDFGAGPQDRAVVSGFHGWEGSFRWMGRRGELRLALLTPSLSFLLGTLPEALKDASGPREIAVQVTAVDEESGIQTPLGAIHVREAQQQLYHLSATPFVSRFGAGRHIRLVLESDRTWTPAGLLPGSVDPRELSVQVFSAGCE
jgi:hypothetical protein